MRTIATLQEPDAGTIKLGDIDVLRQKDEVRRLGLTRTNRQGRGLATFSFPYHRALRYSIQVCFLVPTPRVQH